MSQNEEREYLYIAIIRRRGGKHMQIWKWEFNSKLHHWDSVYIFLWQAAGNFYWFLCLQVGCVLCVFCFWSTQRIVRSLCFSELIFLLILWHLPRTRWCGMLVMLNTTKLGFCPVPSYALVQSMQDHAQPSVFPIQKKGVCASTLDTLWSRKVVDHIKLLIT